MTEARRAEIERKAETWGRVFDRAGIPGEASRMLRECLDEIEALLREREAERHRRDIEGGNR